MGRHRRRAAPTGTLLAALVVLGGLLGGTTVRPPAPTAPAPAAAPGPGASAPARPRPVPDADRAERAAEVRELLDRRARTLLARDRAGFLATVDPRRPAFRRSQEALFDALRDVPLAEWRYEVDDRTDLAAELPLPRRYGAPAYAPDVVLRYRLAGFDPAPTAIPQHPTFVRRSGRWYLAADDDFAPAFRTRRELWDLGPVVVVRGRDSIVLGRPGRAATLRSIAVAADAAVPAVSRVWGSDWVRKVVVVVPDTEAEMARLLGDDGDYAQIAAVAIADLRPDSERYRAVGNRIVVHRGNFDRLGPRGRRVVLAHETTHVATREHSGGAVPVWLVEGFADYVGYRGSGIPVRSAARELAADVVAGRLPRALPGDDQFRGGNARLAQVYEMSWLAVRLLVDRLGEAGVVRLYRELARRPAAPAELSRTLRRMLGTDLAGFTRAWRDHLRAQLA